MLNVSEKTSPLALVLGARGGIGSHVVTTLLQRGWRVRALVRGIPPASTHPLMEWIEGDALNEGDVMKAAEGAALIVHAVNPPGYINWETLVLPMLDNTIRAAEATGARILLPGTVYNFGPDSFPDLTEQSPQRPVTSKGAIRVEMEARLRRASERGVPVLIVRAGDFFGPGAQNNWFHQLVKPRRTVTSVSNPGVAGVGHQWTYLPDMAETIGQLLDRNAELETFAVYHMEGFWDRDGQDMARAIQRVAGRDIPVKRMPWWLFRLASPFVQLFREVLEMRYLWTTPVRMSNEKLVAFLGAEPRTPIDDAVRATLVDMKCL